MGNRRFSNERYEADSEGRCLSRRVFNASSNITSFVVMPLWTLEHRMFVYGSFVKSDESVIETLSSAFHYWVLWVHSKSQYHLKVDNIFSNKRNSNEKETTWSCRKLQELWRTWEEWEKSRQVKIRNERKHSNPTQRYGIPSLQNDGRLEVKRRGFWQCSVSIELMLEIIEEHEDATIMMSDEAHFTFSKETKLPILDSTKSLWNTVAQLESGG